MPFVMIVASTGTSIWNVSGVNWDANSMLPVYLVPKLHCPLCHSKNVGTVLVTEGSEVNDDQVKRLKAHRRKES
jgi:hypothetical protein